MKNYIYILSLSTFMFFSCSNNKQHTQSNKSAEYYYKLGKKYSEKKQGSEIEKIYYDSALYVNPNYAKVWWEKSTWEIKIGNYIKYFEYMDRAVELDPDMYLGWRGVIKLYYLHDYDGALKDFFKMKDMYPNISSLAVRGEDLDFLIGCAYWQKKEFNNAIEYFNRNIDVNGEKSVDVYNFVYLGVCYYEENRKEEAKVELIKTLEFFKECVDAHYYLSKIYFEEGKKEQALKHINEAIEYTNKLYLKKDPYREVFGQIYYSDLLDIKHLIKDY